MKSKRLQIISALILLIMVFAGCARAISVHEAANSNKAKCGKTYIGRG